MISSDLNHLVQEILAPLIGNITAAKKECDVGSPYYGLLQHAVNALICTAMGIEAQCHAHAAQFEIEQPSVIEVAS